MNSTLSQDQITIAERIAAEIKGDATLVSIDSLFSQSSWDDGDGPLDAAALEILGLEDETGDERWFGKFEGSGHNLALYTDEAGNYWIAEYGSRHVLRCLGDSVSEVLEDLGIEVTEEEEA